jgi:phage tail sheath gpL-like
MAVTSIGFQKTPARPTEITFAANTNLPDPNQTVGLIGHMGPTGGAAVSGVASGSAVPYSVVPMSNVAESVAGATEANAKFGEGSELAKMVIAAIKANEAVGSSNFPQITCIPLQQTDADFGELNVALKPKGLAAADKFECEFLVSPYDGEDTVLGDQLEEQAQTMSGATRVQNGQYGTISVAFNRSVQDPSTLHKYDSQFICPAWLRDISDGSNPSFAAPAKSVAEMAAAVAAIMASGTVPFNPQDDKVMGDIDAPSNSEDWITVGAGLESEAALGRGWTPIRVLPNGDVSLVRTVTSRLTTGDGVTQVLSYYDVQDFQVLYFFRKAIVNRLNQPDFKNVKNSAQKRIDAKNAVVKLASDFEDQGMLQAVAQLAPLIVVEQNATDRSRMDIFIPVNVVPGLHVVATNIQATTEFDVITV